MIRVIFGKECKHYQIKKAANISEDIFKTKYDNDQMKSDYHLFLKIAKKFPDFFSLLSLNNKIIGDCICLPCKKDLMKKFLKKKMNEAELTAEILKRLNQKDFDCFFIAEISIKKQHRGKGFASFILFKLIENIKSLKKKNVPIFYWAWSKEGEILLGDELKKMKLKHYFIE